MVNAKSMEVYRQIRGTFQGIKSHVSAEPSLNIIQNVAEPDNYGERKMIEIQYYFSSRPEKTLREITEMVGNCCLTLEEEYAETFLRGGVVAFRYNDRKIFPKSPSDIIYQKIGERFPQSKVL